MTASVRGPFAASCPSRILLDQIADKWSVLILLAIVAEPVRFNALKRQIEGISQKVLTQTLRRLESNGLIYREVFATVPVKVKYSITERGQELSVILERLRCWAIKNI